jgi:hypothetical protein
MTDLALRESTEIQGDVLAGFKKDHVQLLFLKFDDATRARTWLRRLKPRIATTRQVAAFNAAFSTARRNTGGGRPQGAHRRMAQRQLHPRRHPHPDGQGPFPPDRRGHDRARLQAGLRDAGRDARGHG